MSASASAAVSTSSVAESTRRDSVPEIIAASMVGTAIEFYDNYCYSIASASYFGLVFFTSVAKSNMALATLMSFVTFAVSFLARPFGSLLFGHFGDRLGRKKTLVVALLTMGIATFLVGCLPGYDQIGAWSVVILCVCRACQGIGLAGEWSGAALVATENAPKGKRALYGAFPNLGAPIGFFCAYGLNLLLETFLTQDQMVAFGWRIPFLCSSVLVIVGLYVRARMSETPVFAKAAAENRTVRHPLRSLLPYWKEVVLGTLAMGITYTLFYVLGTWSLSYGVSTLGFAQPEYLGMQMVSVLFFAAFIIVGCLWADRSGRRKTLLITTAVTLVFSLVCPMLLGQESVLRVMLFLCVGFVLMGALFGPCGAYLPELFPTKVRYSGAGLSYNLAAILGGAFAPTIATALVTRFGIVSLGWYLAVMAAIALVALFLIKESKDKDYEA
ncbi:MHS family MFS transporter [Bifidobacterium pullorum subsp. saeculare]|uniref:MHS family MFS transporter n=1 Tax=Bifidobacterium pullorum subsp. saeculare TaxID=78257 RepID=A0A938WWX4_9BIFI|nr:MFS transporter [Bifidobacterium pullorum]MBM6700390.1 MHS family MFS transporter [Bifidobacterium pullorum subsp. saeculare]